ncbi:hypothetical protein FHS85_004440 [Rhodoligotrophos appendicifer]|nr:hypothetical protein [Rhodoligotrophos appendicifer]
MRQALAEVKDFPTVLGTGKFTFDANRNPIFGMQLVVIKDGKPELLK